MSLWSNGLARAVAAFIFIGGMGTIPLPAQQLDAASLIQHIDASVQARIDHVAEYTVTEHYAVFRNNDETHPAAEMTVKTVYRKDHGKSYTILSESGSQLIRSEVLGSILENEKRMSLPGTRETALITSANYELNLKSAEKQTLAGRECLVFALKPKRMSPYLFDGTLWVDAKDFSIVQLEGMAAKSHSFLTGPAQVSRQYAMVSGFPMATHAKAVSNSFLLGQTIVTIDYTGYQVQHDSAR
jgi:outer membrane lipoprotein-sorting protein